MLDPRLSSWRQDVELVHDDVQLLFVHLRHWVGFHVPLTVTQDGDECVQHHHHEEQLDHKPNQKGVRFINGLVKEAEVKGTEDQFEGGHKTVEEGVVLAHAAHYAGIVQEGVQFGDVHAWSVILVQVLCVEQLHEHRAEED